MNHARRMLSRHHVMPDVKPVRAVVPDRLAVDDLRQEFVFLAEHLLRRLLAFNRGDQAIGSVAGFLFHLKPREMVRFVRAVPVEAGAARPVDLERRRGADAHVLDLAYQRLAAKVVSHALFDAHDVTLVLSDGLGNSHAGVQDCGTARSASASCVFV